MSLFDELFPDFKRSGISMDPDTVKTCRKGHKITMAHQHPHDPPTIMYSDPENRGGYVCPSCGDELGSGDAALLIQDVKIDIHVEEKEEADLQWFGSLKRAPVPENKVTETSMFLRFYGQSREGMIECVEKMAGAGMKIAGFMIKPMQQSANILLPEELAECHEVELYFDSQADVMNFYRDQDGKRIYNRLAKAGKFADNKASILERKPGDVSFGY